MLAGQELSTTQTLLIAVVGMAVVLFELGLLAFFISIFSKLVASKKPAPAKAAAAPAVAAAAPQGLQVAVTAPGGAPANDEEIAAAIAAVFAESARRS